MTRRIPSKKVAREHWSVYWDKAMEFFETMIDAAQKDNWNAVGLAGVHCCVSVTDALLVKQGGFRSSSDSHQDTVALLRSVINNQDVAKQARRLAEILAEKNLIEYVDKSYPQEKALALKTNVERYIEWVRKLI